MKFTENTRWCLIHFSVSSLTIKQFLETVMISRTLSILLTCMGDNETFFEKEINIIMCEREEREKTILHDAIVKEDKEDTSATFD